eukprot:2989439-Rhodomonas_salina.3
MHSGPRARRRPPTRGDWASLRACRARDRGVGSALQTSGAETTRATRAGAAAACGYAACRPASVPTPRSRARVPRAPCDAPRASAWGAEGCGKR